MVARSNTFIAFTTSLLDVLMSEPWVTASRSLVSRTLKGHEGLPPAGPQPQENRPPS